MRYLQGIGAQSRVLGTQPSEVLLQLLLILQQGLILGAQPCMLAL